jgi:hypothetical protein
MILLSERLALRIDAPLEPLSIVAREDAGRACLLFREDGRRGAGEEARLATGRLRHLFG